MLLLDAPSRCVREPRRRGDQLSHRDHGEHAGTSSLVGSCASKSRPAGRAGAGIVRRAARRVAPPLSEPPKAATLFVIRIDPAVARIDAAVAAADAAAAPMARTVSRGGGAGAGRRVAADGAAARRREPAQRPLEGH